MDNKYKQQPDYDLLVQQVKALGEEENYWLPVLANTSALLMNALPDLNWAGFYLMNRDSLVLGPLQPGLYPHPVVCRRVRRGGAAEQSAAGGRRASVPRAHCLRQRQQCGNRDPHPQKRKTGRRTGFGQPLKEPLYRRR